MTYIFQLLFLKHKIMVLEYPRVFKINSMYVLTFLSLEDFDVEEEDEEALIEQRRIQRQAIVQVCDFSKILISPP